MSLVDLIVEIDLVHVFISYVRENKEIVDRLASELRALSISVWIDRDQIKPGMYWKDAINQAIREGAFFIACYSKELNDRIETYMHGELRLAIDRLRNIPRNRVWFIPVLLNDTEIPNHPISDHENINDINAVKLFNNWDNGIIMILQAMNLADDNCRRVLQLIDLIKNHPLERCYAIEQLEGVGDVARLAVPALIEVFRDPDFLVRHNATYALGKIGSAAVPALTEALRSLDKEVCRHAAEALMKIGPAAVDAVPALIRILCDTDWIDLFEVGFALSKIGPAAIPALIKVLGHPREASRWEAANALVEIGPAAVPALTEALRDPYERVRQEAADALSKILIETT